VETSPESDAAESPYAPPKQLPEKGRIGPWTLSAIVSLGCIAASTMVDVNQMASSAANLWALVGLAIPIACSGSPIFFTSENSATGSALRKISRRFATTAGSLALILLSLFLGLYCARAILENLFRVESWLELEEASYRGLLLAFIYTAIRTLTLFLRRRNFIYFGLLHCAGSLLILVPFFVFMDECKEFSKDYFLTFLCLMFGCLTYSDVLAQSLVKDRPK